MNINENVYILKFKNYCVFVTFEATNPKELLKFIISNKMKCWIVILTFWIQHILHAIIETKKVENKKCSIYLLM